MISDVSNDTENVGNQFVWIPVDDISNFKREVGYSHGKIQTSAFDVIDFEKCEEPYSSAGASERKEYENMINGVKEYKGFYIGRYEISQSEDGSERPQSKKNKNPWVNITLGASMTNTYGGIVDIARSMYPYRENLKKGEVVSTLIYGTAWSETIRFLKTNEKYKNIDKDSTGFGNGGTNKVIATGSNERYSLNNIYDMSGNVWEWTMEVYNGQGFNVNIGRICSGGSYVYNLYNAPISIRGGGINIFQNTSEIGGRIQLYIK